VAHLYRDEKRTPQLTGQYLCIPTTCDPVAFPEKYKDVYLSREQNKDALVLNQKSIDMFEGKLWLIRRIYTQGVNCNLYL
jgi:hypothetical protein